MFRRPYNLVKSKFKKKKLSNESRDDFISVLEIFDDDTR